MTKNARLPHARTISPRLEIENRRFPLDHTLFHPEVGIVATAIPKSGCSALRKWYIAMAEPDTPPNSVDAHKYCLERFALCQRDRDETAGILHQHPGIAFVRDPLARLRSGFIEKIVRPRPTDMFVASRELLEDWTRTQGPEVRYDITHRASIGGEIFEFPASTSVNYDRGITFREFVQYVCETSDNALDPHWRSQGAFLRDHPVDLIAPLDMLGPILDALSTAMGRPLYKVEKTNVTRKEPAARGSLADTPSGELHRLDLRPPVDELADTAILNYVRSSLAPDFELFASAMNSFAPGSIEAVLGRRTASGLHRSSPTI